MNISKEVQQQLTPVTYVANRRRREEENTFAEQRKLPQDEHLLTKEPHEVSETLAWMSDLQQYRHAIHHHLRYCLRITVSPVVLVHTCKHTCKCKEQYSAVHYQIQHPIICSLGKVILPIHV